MTENKTQPTQVGVTAFLNEVENDTRRRDALALAAMMQRVTGIEPQMWGPSIVGFGSQRYRYESGREGDMPRIGFSPRKANLVLYMLGGPRRESLLAQLGKHRTGASCLYINRLSDVNLSVLEALAADAWATSNEHGD